MNQELNEFLSGLTDDQRAEIIAIRAERDSLTRRGLAAYEEMVSVNAERTALDERCPHLLVHEYFVQDEHREICADCWRVIILRGPKLT